MLIQNSIFETVMIESDYRDHTLLLASYLINSKDFPNFLTETAIPIIDKYISKSKSLSSIIQFCQRIPDKLLSKKFIHMFLIL